MFLFWLSINACLVEMTWEAIKENSGNKSFTAVVHGKCKDLCLSQLWSITSRLLLCKKLSPLIADEMSSLSVSSILAHTN